MRAFIYGTLKRGHRANGMLAGQRYVAEGITAVGYRLYDCGGYPGLVRDDASGSVRGELWELDPASFESLDEYEGVAQGIYERSQIILADGTAATTYLYLRPVAALRDCGVKWTLEQESADPRS